MKRIEDLMTDKRFIIETVVGPYICEWRWVEGLPGIVMVERYKPDNASSEGSPAPTSPIPPALNAGAYYPVVRAPLPDVRGIIVESGGIPLP